MGGPNTLRVMDITDKGIAVYRLAPYRIFLIVSIPEGRGQCVGDIRLDGLFEVLFGVIGWMNLQLYRGTLQNFGCLARYAEDSGSSNH
ncbi:hypothetical protein PVK06_025269 [Gossypium arboreum]|uniref:Uncharacterized protein n=1 Tax=Gossypium arboreum TaxID=29729 RepID=A0ABR0PGB0_GOSAR|nr:hypothetical protein PVK06_025269 [Gossypium arboreum]